jgi:hypothetical protein
MSGVKQRQAVSASSLAKANRSYADHAPGAVSETGREGVEKAESIGRDRKPKTEGGDGRPN